MKLTTILNETDRPSLKAWLAALIIPMTLLPAGCGSESTSGDDSAVEGYFVSEGELSKDWRVNSQIDLSSLANYISQQRSKSTWLKSDNLAKQIDIVAKCFQVDPYILAGLIKTESRFMPEAVSPTGAVGLTQFTGIAIDEVHDQTGRRGTGRASAGAIRYFNGVVDGCIKSNFPQLSHVLLWKTTNNRSSQKNALMEKPELSLIYGAILLKTYLAYRATSSSSKLSVYDKALQQYNGEPGNRKVKYASNVLAAARAIGLNTKSSGIAPSNSTSKGVSTPQVSAKTPTTANPKSAPTAKAPAFDPAAYEIYLMYKDGMQDGRAALAPQVSDMQRRLQRLGYSIAIDGKYGDQTATVVGKFQRDQGHITDAYGFSQKDWRVLQQKAG